MSLVRLVSRRSRPIRIEYAHAVYHIMARGNQGQQIYTDDGDRKMWLATLVEARRRTGWRIHAWALMGNHYHLLVETPEPNLVSGMKWLQGTYTQRFNARHRQRGHLFQGRYRAVPVDVEEPEYFQTVSTYIHLNPARANFDSDWRAKAIGLSVEQLSPLRACGTTRVVGEREGFAESGLGS
jgi:putative transposase